MKKITFSILAIVFFLSSNAQQNYSNNAFAIKMYKAMVPNSKNIFISPFSINTAFHTLKVGASGSTRKEINDFLSVPSSADKDFIKLYNKTMDGSTIGATNQLCIANAVWVKDNIHINDFFVKAIEKDYSAETFTFNVNNIDVANNSLSSWIKAKTKGKIEYENKLSASSELNIINAIYFLSEWKDPFDSQETKQKKFFSIDKKVVDKQFMTQMNYYKYFEDKVLESLQLPYKEDNFTMMILLPKKKYGIPEIEHKLSEAYVQNIKSSATSKLVKATLPKFKIESLNNLKSTVASMGYSLMFSDNADFSNISKAPLKLGEVTSQTFIEVNEEGTEAAGMTMLSILAGGTAKPKYITFNANSPFIFLIIDNRTDAILFMGRLVY